MTERSITRSATSMYERQKAYRQRKAEYVAGLEATLRDIAHMFRASDKSTAIKVRAMALKALGDDEQRKD